MAKRQIGASAGALALFIAAVAAAPALAQQTEGAVPAFRLRGVEQPVSAPEDIFADGGIEAANRADEDEAPPVPTRAPRPGEERQGRAARAQPAPAVGVDLDAGLTDPRDNVSAGAVEPGAPRQEDDDPFAPQGLRLGSWRAFLTAGQSLGYSTNVARAAGGEAGWISRSTAGVEARSDWARHEASIVANGAYERALDGSGQELPAAGIEAGLRLDLADGVEADLRGVYNYSTESSGGIGGGGIGDRAGVHGYGATAEIGRFGRRLQLSLRGVAQRTVYEAAELAGGGALDQSDRDNTTVRLVARAGYEVSTALVPFVEAGVGRRIQDLEADRNGDDRSATLYDMRAGVALDLSEKLSGELSAGYLAQDYDGGLDTLGAIAFGASIVWSPQRETEIRFAASTELEGSSIAGDSGAVTRSFTVEAERRATDRLSLRANAGYRLKRSADGDASEATWTAGAGMTWWINRFLGVTADIGHERLSDDDAASSFAASQATVGLTFRR